MTLWDDVFFRKASEDNDFCEEMLQTFLDDSTLKVVSNTPQKEVLNLQGRSVVLDLLCTLGSGKTVNVEVQKTNPKSIDHLRRVRYNASAITANITKPSIDFKSIPNLIVIYLTKGDIFKSGFTKYCVANVLYPSGKIVDDGLTRIFINGSIDDKSNISKLMKVFSGNKNFKDEFPKISNRISFFTEKEEGVAIMTSLAEEILGDELISIKNESFNQGEIKGRKEGEKKGKRDILGKIKDMINNKCSVEDINRFVDNFKN